MKIDCTGRGRLGLLRAFRRDGLRRSHEPHRNPRTEHKAVLHDGAIGHRFFEFSDDGSSLGNIAGDCVVQTFGRVRGQIDNGPAVIQAIRGRLFDTCDTCIDHGAERTAIEARA